VLGGVSPLESLATFLESIGARDVFVVLDTPPTPEDESVADAGPSIGPSLLDSSTRATRVLQRIQPISVDFEDSRRGESAYWNRTRKDICVKPGAALQARKLQRCWGRVRDHEESQGFSYSHVIRLRPDMLLPHSLAAHVVDYVRESTPLVSSSGHESHREPSHTQSPEQASSRFQRRAHRALPHKKPTHAWGREVCLRRHEMSGAVCQVECDESDAASPPDVLTIPPFTPLLRNDTFGES